MRKLLLLLTIFTASSAFATPARVSGQTAICLKGAASTTALTCSLPNPPTVGNSIILGLQASTNFSGSYTVTDNATGGSNTFTVRVYASGGVSMASAQASANVVRTNAGTYTVSVTPSVSNTQTIIMAEYSGIDATAVDTSGTVFGSASGTSATLTITTTNATDLIVGTVDTRNGTTLSNAGTIALTVNFTGSGNSGQIVGMMDLATTSTVSGTTRFSSINMTAASAYPNIAVVAYQATASATKIKHRVSQ